LEINGNITDDSITGAEGTIEKIDFYRMPAVIKIRKRKSYRIEEIDTKVRMERLKKEIRLMHKAKYANIDIPHIYYVSFKDMSIIMEYIDGETLKDYLSNTKRQNDIDIKLMSYIGKKLGMMHGKGIYHGDLTASNIILFPDKSVYRIYFIDFSMGGDGDLEDFAIDMLTLKKTMMNDALFEEIMKNYDNFENISKKMKEIEKRGRYL